MGEVRRDLIFVSGSKPLTTVENQVVIHLKTLFISKKKAQCYRVEAIIIFRQGNLILPLGQTASDLNMIHYATEKQIVFR